MLIYEAYNKQNGKVYVGLTTTSLEKRRSSHLRSAKNGSNAYFHKAIRKYGEESFEWDVILTNPCVEELYELEKMVITDYEDHQTYNVSKGGEHSAYGMKHTEKVKKICGEYAKQRWDGKRAKDRYPEWVFELGSYREAQKHGIPKTTWYRQKRQNNS